MNQPSVILVADDNRDVADSLSQMLSLMGYDTIAVHNGMQAVSACRERWPALAILDVQMPCMDGLEAAAAIRDLGGPPVALASLTSVQRNGVPVGQGWDAFDAHLSKPLDVADLQALLAQVFPRPSQ